jgi:hypothetical protein
MLIGEAYAKRENYGKHSPGPIYEYPDQTTKYTKQGGFPFGT